MIDWFLEWVKECLNKWMSEWMYEQLNEWVSERWTIAIIASKIPLSKDLSVFSDKILPTYSDKNIRIFEYYSDSGNA